MEIIDAIKEVNFLKNKNQQIDELQNMKKKERLEGADTDKYLEDALADV